jgi:Holliday junction resolvasome RuvABC endonuclease subunit
MILCIDIGFANTGWCIIDPEKNKFNILKSECIHTTKSKDKKLKVSHDDSNRNQHTFQCLLDILSENKDITGIAIELPTSGAKSSNALKGMAMASAVVSCFVKSSGIPHYFVTPTDVKNVIKNDSGRKSSEAKVEKDEIMNFIKKEFPDFEFPKTKKKFEHIADSVAVGLSLIGNAFYKNQLDIKS